MQPREADSFAALRNDSKKSKGNGNGRSGFPEGMTARKARATATEEADSRGNDSKKSKGNGNGNGRSRFPEGMTARKARATATEEADSRRE